MHGREGDGGGAGVSVTCVASRQGGRQKGCRGGGEIPLHPLGDHESVGEGAERWEGRWVYGWLGWLKVVRRGGEVVN